MTGTVHPASHRPVRIGVQLAPQHATYVQLREAVRRGEDIGVDALFNWDHFFPLTEPLVDDHYEAWTGKRLPNDNGAGEAWPGADGRAV